VNTHDTVGMGTVCHGAPKIKTVPVPVTPILETPQVYPYPNTSLCACDSTLCNFCLKAKWCYLSSCGSPYQLNMYQSLGLSLRLGLLILEVGPKPAASPCLGWAWASMGLAWQAQGLRPSLALPSSNIHHILGIRVIHDRKSRTITLNQTVYIENIFGQFRMQDCAPVHTLTVRKNSHHHNCRKQTTNSTNLQACSGD
jgi:hypothetical protein